MIILNNFLVSNITQIEKKTKANVEFIFYHEATTLLESSQFVTFFNASGNRTVILLLTC